MIDSVWVTLTVTVLSGILPVGCAREPVSDSAGLQPNSPRDQLVHNQEEGLPRNSDPGVESEVAKLEGPWVGVSFHIDGLEAAAPQWYRYSFDGDRMTTETSLGDTGTVRFHLDPHAEPKRLDTAITVDGVEEISKGIYVIDGDRLKLSWRVAGDRPTDFEPRDGDDKIVLVLRRADASEALSYEDAYSQRGSVQAAGKTLYEHETHVRYKEALTASDEKAFFVLAVHEFENHLTKRKCYVFCQIEGQKPASKDPQDAIVHPTGTATWTGPIVNASSVLFPENDADTNER
jgi:uncharacterized protein (TIGR03067 family)